MIFQSQASLDKLLVLEVHPLLVPEGAELSTCTFLNAVMMAFRLVHLSYAGKLWYVICGTESLWF